MPNSVAWLEAKDWAMRLNNPKSFMSMLDVLVQYIKHASEARLGSVS